ncbi:DUF695 domain-containing protein [Erythrobacter donghaensis]|uniref:DUF695 domain-containing protein n=1 Tax=Erythrobacter donghaensis TaxID=267135 RepID=UPI00093DE0E5|nr:DUF695 domain-containing protein [Erythrobacter donghaensis]
MSSSGIFPSDQWTVASGKTESGLMIARFRSGEPSDADRELFGKLVLVRWPFEQREGSGLPTNQAMAAMDEFEDRILEASDADRWWGSGVAVITHEGTREWRFYTPDVDSFVQEFSAALRGLGPYPLELQAFDDPDWNGFAEIRAIGIAD